ncbi:HlyD family secretion protein [Microbulbifer elongatus]|uniref:HlyD family secretion protein n=1 Tax=Microbulbifer elongatus TaxID=86173 RepID=UPI001CFE38B5|nr:HlyD family efflux transporter periplasmic adaptor subunit [Microbulbifer elongatus]
MSTPFSRTTRALHTDNSRTTALLSLGGLALLLGWLVWALFARIDLYKISRSATLQLSAHSTDISVRYSGTVVEVFAQLGDQVTAGAPLVRLDAAAADIELAGESAQTAALQARLDAIRQERQLLQDQFQQASQAQQSELASLKELLALQQSNRAIQIDVTDRYATLLQKQQGAELDYLEAKRALQNITMAVKRAEADIRTAQFQLQQLDTEHQRALTALAQTEDSVRQQLSASSTRQQQHQLTVDKLLLRAPMDGRLASLSALRTGQPLAAGTVIGSIQAPSELRVRAQFSPADAIGHIAPRQTAHIRLEGFPWARYGQLQGRVERVAEAVQNGSIQVQLVITGEPPNGLPLRHDLPAQVEVTTGRTSPMSLLLQKAGNWLNKTPAASEPGQMTASRGASGS